MTSAEGSSALNDPLIGQVVQGRYLVRRILGKGGMGVVYEAQHLLIGRKVALKVLSRRGLLSNASIARFRREARAAASVGNSHIVDVLDMGKLDDGSLFIVLEYLEGVELGWAVADSGRFKLSRAVSVLCQLCEALAAVHRAGIVHRDLKPENILLIQRDEQADFVKVLDFGVCRFKDRDGMSLTASSDTVGTPLFMAPEQIENVSSIDQRTDVYALGAIFYFLLTGRTPFDAATLPKLWIRICMEPPPKVRALDESLPAEVDVIIQRALSKSPELRFQSCDELRRALVGLEAAAGRPSQIRLRQELAATLPATTAALYMSDDAASASVPAAAFAPPAPGRRYLALGGAALVAVSALAIVGSSIVLSQRGAPPVAAAGATKAVTSVPPPSAEASATPNPVVPDPPLATSKPSIHRELRRSTSPSREPPTGPNEPPASGVTTDVSVKEFPPAAEARDEPSVAPAAAAEAAASPPEIRLNREPKRGL